MKKCPFCAEEIQLEAVVCKHCGRDLPGHEQAESKTKSARTEVSPGVAVLVIALGIVAILVWNFGSYSGGYSGGTDTSGRYVVPQRIAAPAPVVTMSEFSRIREGMSYAEVKRIIGAPGEESSRSDLAGYTTVMYSWMNDNGSNMNAMFQNDALVSKAQFGLP